MKTRKFVLIYFKTVKATQSTQGKKDYSAKKSQHAAEENEFTPEQRKTRPQKKKNLANSSGAGYASYFKAVFVCVVAARYLTSEQFSLSRLVLVA